MEPIVGDSARVYELALGEEHPFRREVAEYGHICTVVYFYCEEETLLGQENYRSVAIIPTWHHCDSEDGRVHLEMLISALRHLDLSVVTPDEWASFLGEWNDHSNDRMILSRELAEINGSSPDPQASLHQMAVDLANLGMGRLDQVLYGLAERDEEIEGVMQIWVKRGSDESD